MTIHFLKISWKVKRENERLKFSPGKLYQNLTNIKKKIHKKTLNFGKYTQRKVPNIILQVLFKIGWSLALWECSFC